MRLVNTRNCGRWYVDVSVEGLDVPFFKDGTFIMPDDTDNDHKLWNNFLELYKSADDGDITKMRGYDLYHASDEFVRRM